MNRTASPITKHVATLSVAGLLAASVLVAPLSVFADESKTIAQNAQDTPALSTLVTALDTAGLVETFNDEDASFTVFAPTNDAFTAATAELGVTTEELLALPNLGDILKYHVVNSVALSSDLSDGQAITTLTGGTLTVDIQGSDVFIVDEQNRRAQVVTADVESSNGVVHVIDKVVLEATDETPATLEDTGMNLTGFYLIVIGSLGLAAFVYTRSTRQAE